MAVNVFMPTRSVVVVAPSRIVGAVGVVAASEAADRKPCASAGIKDEAEPLRAAAAVVVAGKVAVAMGFTGLLVPSPIRTRTSGQ